MNIRSIVFLILERTIEQTNIPAAIDKMSSVGRNADHAPFPGSRNDTEPMKFDIAATLRDYPHAPAMVKVYVADRDALRIGNRKSGIKASGRAEDHDVADAGFQIVPKYPNQSAGLLPGYDRMLREPIIVHMKSRFSLHGIEFQQTGKRICRTFVVEKAQASVRQVTNVLSGKLHIQPSGTRRPNDTFGVERSGIIDRKVADRHIAASFQVKRRDKAGEEKLRAGSFDRKIPHAFQIEGDPFQTLVVVAYELIFFFGPVRTQPQFAARQYETGRTGLRTVCHCRPYRRNSIAFGRCRIEKVAQINVAAIR